MARPLQRVLDARDALHESLFWMAVAWLPLAVTAAMQSLVGRPPGPLLSAPDVHIRLVAAIPLFVLGRRVICVRSEGALASLRNLGTLDARDRPLLEQAERRLQRLSSSRFAGTVLLLLSVASGLLIAPPDATGVLGLWYRFVGLAVFRFVLLLALYRWIIWFLFLLRVSMIQLDLEAAHPDGSAGLGRLAHATVGFALIMSGTTSVVVARWAPEVLEAGSLKPMLTVLAAQLGATIALAFAPLLAFAPQLIRARMQGLARYSLFALRLVRKFQERHLAPGASADPPDMGGDVQTMADLGNTVEMVKRTRIVPFDRRSILAVLLITGLPALAMAIAVTPTAELLASITKVVTGIR